MHVGDVDGSVVRNMDLQRAKDGLLRLRSRLAEQDEALGESLGISLEEEAGEESSDQHLADVGSVTLTREIDVSMRSNVEHLLSQVDRALEKIEEGTYGFCDRCGEPIEESRLQTVPEATLCLKHQQELERLQQS
jgi:DnaK suppressor protein